MYKNNTILRNFYQFLADFCHFFAHSSQNAGTIANKFKLHMYFRFQ